MRASWVSLPPTLLDSPATASWSSANTVPRQIDTRVPPANDAAHLKGSLVIVTAECGSPCYPISTATCPPSKQS
jgi:hypothetical protein